MKRRGLIFAVVAVVVVGVAFFWERGRRVRKLQEAGGTPALPEKVEPRALRDRIEAADARAKSGSLAALGELSRLYHANGFLTEATRCYRALQQLQADEPRWWHRPATILAGRGDSEPALAAWRRVTSLAPDYLPAQLRLGDLLLKLNRLDDAAAVYRGVLAREAANPHAELGLARIEFEREQWQPARERLERLVRATDYTFGYDLIVTVYERLGLADAAAGVRSRLKASGAHRDPVDPWMNELTDDCYDPYQLALAAGAAQRSGDPAAAIRWLERAAMLAPADPAIPFQLARIFSDRRDGARAREQLERCTTIAPEFADGWAHLSALLEQNGDSAGAERVLAEGLRRCPESPGLHLMRARSFRKAGRAGDAIASYRASIRLRPNEAEPHVELATLLLQANRAPEALAVLQQAMAVEPDHPTALALLALQAMSANDEPAARRWLARVRAQPRVPAAQVQQLLTTYRQQFGRAFEW